MSPFLILEIGLCELIAKRFMTQVSSCDNISANLDFDYLSKCIQGKCFERQVSRCKRLSVKVLAFDYQSKCILSKFKH